MSLRDFFSIIIFFGGGFSLIIALSVLISKKHNINDTLIAVLLICLGIIQIRAYMMTTGLAFKYPLISFLHLPVIFSLGPLLYLCYQSMLDSMFKINVKKILNFIPAFIIMIAEIIFQLLTPYDESCKLRRDIALAFLTMQPPAVMKAIKYVALSACVYNMFYYIINFKSVLSLYSIEDMDRQKRVLLLILCISVIPPVFFIFIFLLMGSILYLLIAISIITIIVLFAYLMSQRYPGLMQNISLEMRRKRYERSLLNGINVDNIHRRLIELMEDEKIYTDERITLPHLAEKLQITPHQLSEFLNERLNMNFNSYINKYRIKEAMEVLSRDTDLSVLQVAYSVGFNSKSAFNTAFRRVTGTTPLNFRNGKATDENLI